MPILLKQTISSAADLIQAVQGSISIVPGWISASVAPASPVVIDTRGAFLRKVILETVGACWIEIECSVQSTAPANQADLDSGAATVPDYSNIRWHHHGHVTVTEPGDTILAAEHLQAMSQCRYVRLSPVGASATLQKIHIYAT